MSMTEFERKLISELKGIRRELEKIRKAPRGCKLLPGIEVGEGVLEELEGLTDGTGGSITGTEEDSEDSSGLDPMLG